MPIINAYFVSQGGFEHEIISKTVVFFTHGEKIAGHAALRVPKARDREDVLLEAIRPEVTLSEGNKYDSELNLAIVDIQVPDELYFILEDTVHILGSSHIPYGLGTDCINDGLHDAGELIHKGCRNVLAKQYSELVNCEKTMNCSETLTRALRSIFPKYMKEEDANCVTPYQAFLGLIEAHHDQLLKVLRIRYGDGREIVL